MLQLHKLLRRQLVALKYLDNSLCMDSALKNVQNVQRERLNSKALTSQRRQAPREKETVVVVVVVVEEEEEEEEETRGPSSPPENVVVERG